MIRTPIATFELERPTGNAAARRAHDGRLALGDQADGLRAVRNELDPRTPIERRVRPATRKIAVTSGKGGVGKTQLTANLAAAFAGRGRRVLLLDADLGLANLDLVLGVEPRADVLSVVSGERAMRDVVVPCPSGVTLVPACPGRYEMANLDARGRTMICEALDVLALEHDLVLIDTAAGIGPGSVAFAAHADRVVLVATPDPASIRDVYAMTKVLCRRAGILELDFVANQVTSEAEGHEVYENVATLAHRFLGAELRYLGHVPRDEAVRDATLAGRPLVLRSPDSMAARAVQAIARRIDPSPDRRASC